MTKLRCFQSGLITLGRCQDVHPFLVCQLCESSAVHWSTTLLLCFERLSGIASVDHQQELPCVHTFKSPLEFAIRDAVSEDSLQSCGVDPAALSAETQIVRDKIKLILLRCAVPGEIDYYSV